MSKTILMNDSDIASALRMSRSWVRKQRYLRKRDLPHAFDIDPVMVGSVPRYWVRDVMAWLAKQRARSTWGGV
jgi:hypothetical protein